MKRPKNKEKIQRASKRENPHSDPDINKKVVRSPTEILRKRIMPLYKEPYKFQLEHKYRYVKNHLSMLTRNVYKHAINRGLEPPDWCVHHNEPDESEGRKEASHGNVTHFPEILLKPVLSIKGSCNDLYSYRNKCEFTIGFTSGEVFDIDSEISVGFVSHIDRFEPIVIGITNEEEIISANEDDTKECVPQVGDREKSSSTGRDYFSQDGEQIEIIHPCALKIVRETERIVKLSSRENDYKVYSRRNRNGIWRLLLVRISETHNEIMIVVQTTKLDVNSKKAITELLISHLSGESDLERDSFSKMNYKVSSLYLHQSDSIVDTFEGGELELIWGKPKITFNICNTNLSIGPLSFFQTNTKGCEVLYRVIKEMVIDNYIEYLKENNRTENKSSNLLILDICCGSGAIGITILNAFRELMNQREFDINNIKLYGIDCCEEAIESAKLNAIHNNINNAQYLSDTAENSLPKLLSELPLKESYTIAIVDPPRSGLHANVVKSFRELTEIENLIYVSCNVESLIKNCLDLCSVYDPVKDKKKENTHFNVFEPMYAVPVDMFPYTKHVEVVLYLSRRATQESKSNSKKQRIMNNPLLN